MSKTLNLTVTIADDKSASISSTTVSGLTVMWASGRDLQAALNELNDYAADLEAHMAKPVEQPIKMFSKEADALEATYPSTPEIIGALRVAYLTKEERVYLQRRLCGLQTDARTTLTKNFEDIYIDWCEERDLEL